MSEGILSKLNQGQKEAATTLEGPMLVLAGAGAGKTHTMTSRVAYMVFLCLNATSLRRSY